MYLPEYVAYFNNIALQNKSKMGLDRVKAICISEKTLKRNEKHTGATPLIEAPKTST